jgi:hypothetical protein
MHYATSAGQISTGKMSQAKESFLTAEAAEERRGRGQRKKIEGKEDACWVPCSHGGALAKIMSKAIHAG